MVIEGDVVLELAANKNALLAKVASRYLPKDQFTILRKARSRIVRH